MKIKYLEIKNYKQFKDVTLDLTYPEGHKKAGEPLDKICIIGQSGTGKTNLLNIIKKSVIDFSEHKSSYKPFSNFIGESTDDKYITTEFISKSNIKIKTLFTEKKSEINFEKNQNNILEDTEKNYFIGTKDYSLFNNKSPKDEDIETFEMSMSDRALLNKLTTAKAELTFEQLNNPFSLFDHAIGKKNPSEKLADINSAIRDLESKYYRKYNIDKSLLDIKKKNFIDRYIININDDIDNLWTTMQKRIDNYQLLRGQFIDTLSNKLLEDDNYTKDDYKNEIAAWEDINENLLNKISLEINTVLNKFNLELTKIDENQSSYNSFTIKDLSNGNIIKYDNLSTGTKNLLSTFIPLKTYAPKDSIILIDEPEMSFYPDIQRQLTDLYMSISTNNQLIMATHSPLIASSFEPWEVVELKFDSNNQVYREKYYEGENHIDNYILDPRLLTWTGILTDIFDLKEDSNFTFREEALMKYIRLERELKEITDKKLKKEKFEELMKLSDLLGLSGNEKD